MFPEWMVVLPLWETGTENYPFRNGQLGLPSALEEALASWNHAWQDRSDDEPLPDEAGWREQGVALWTQTQHHLDGIAEVRPEFLW